MLLFMGGSKMKITRYQLKSLIQQSLNEKKTIKTLKGKKIVSQPYAAAADVGMRLKQKWQEKTDTDPKVRRLMGDLWKNTSVSDAQADPENKEEFIGDPKRTDNWPWSAATISTMYAGDPNFKSHRSGTGKGSASHADYMKAAYDNRLTWLKGKGTSSSKYKYPGFVAFKPSEYTGKKGDIVCTPRGSGDGWKNVGNTNHCDVCLDDACSSVVGGNIGDKLTIREKPAGISMVITKNPKIAVSETIQITVSELRNLITEAINTKYFK
jgi:hypothetical protein